MTKASQTLAGATTLAAIALIAGATGARAQVQVLPSNQTTTTLTTATVLNVTTAPPAAATDTYRTELTARLGNGPALYDQILVMPFSSAAFQSAVITAEAALTAAAAGPISFDGPRPLGNPTVTMTGGSVSSTSTSITYTGHRITNGPAQTPAISNSPNGTIFGELTCTGISRQFIASGSLFAPTGGTILEGTTPTGCTGGGSVLITTGNSNVDTVITTVTDRVDTPTGANRLTSQSFEIVGLAEGAMTAVPEPGTASVLAAGLLGLVATARRTRRS